MQYKQHPNTSLFLPDPADGTVAAAWYFAKNNTGAPPAAVTVRESWDTWLGFYIFLEHAIDASDNTALDALAAGLAASPLLDEPLHTGALWLLNTPDVSSIQIKTIIDVSADATPALLKNADAGFGRYRLPFLAGMPLTFNADAAILYFGYPGQDGAQESSILKGLNLPVLGADSGVVSGEAMVNDFSNNPLTGWSAGFTYVSSYNGGQAQFYPLFDVEANRYVVFALRWDPLHPLAPERTSLAFTGISFLLEKIEGTPGQFQILPHPAPNVLSAYWKTLYGKSIALSPSLSGTHAARLVFQLGMDPATGSQAYYLSPDGAFELRAAGAGTGQALLLCGLAGTECLQVSLGGDDLKGGDRLIFYPGNGAYTRDYPVVQPSAGQAGVLRATVSESLLNTTYTTSWATVQQAAGNPDVLYFAAPGTASLYAPGDTSDVFDAYYAQAAQIVPITLADGPFSFPMAPYAGILQTENGGFSASDITKFEYQIIGAVRRQIMIALPAGPVTASKTDEVTATTPQGLLATIVKGLWQEVLLARNDGLRENFAFTNLPNILRNAFQTNELFLIASDKANLGDFKNKVGIEGWTFNVNVPLRNPGEDPQHKNILLLKFRKGAILDLIQDVNAWTSAQQFNYDNNQVTGVQTWLIQYCNDAIAMAAGNDRYAHFASIVQDPNWYGVLALKVDVDLGGFPPDLKGLLGAMDISLLNAHHVGVQVNYIESSTAQNIKPEITVKKSNLFALISYIDPDYQNSQGNSSSLTAGANPSLSQVAYAYKVLTLQVVFLNSAIVNFESKLQLTAREWFGEAATLNKPGGGASQPANYAMLFNGHYENHDGHRTYTFLTQKGLTYQYFITSRIVNYVQFVKASFGTVSTIADTANPGMEDVNSRFTFYGYLNYVSLPEFDCFSFGSETGQEALQNRGLYFSNMNLDVNFKLDTIKNVTSNLSIIFAPAQVAFDLSLSTVRAASFAQGFPLSPAAILQGSGGNAPPQAGYVALTPPVDFISGTLGPNWYGLDLDFHWGGPGALADMAGFTPHLLLAWSPSATQSVGIFIRLPGSAGGGKTFSLQNVLKLTAGTLRLQIVKGDNGQISYNLLLTSLALSVLGLKFPPVGNTNLALLGDPSQPGSMGWYGAFINR